MELKNARSPYGRLLQGEGPWGKLGLRFKDRTKGLRNQNRAHKVFRGGSGWQSCLFISTIKRERGNWVQHH